MGPSARKPGRKLSSPTDAPVAVLTEVAHIFIGFGVGCRSVVSRLYSLLALSILHFFCIFPCDLQGFFRMTRLGGVHPPPGTLQHRSEILEALPRHFSGPTPISTRIGQQAAVKMPHWRNNGRCLESDSSLIPFSDFPCPRRKTGNKTISQTAPYSGRRLCTRSEPRWGAWQPTLYTCMGVFQAFVVSAGLGSSRLSYLCWLSKLRTLMHRVAYAVVTYDDDCTVSFFMCVPA